MMKNDYILVKINDEFIMPFPLNCTSESKYLNITYLPIHGTSTKFFLTIFKNKNITWRMKILNKII